MRGFYPEVNVNKRCDWFWARGQICRHAVWRARSVTCSELKVHLQQPPTAVLRYNHTTHVRSFDRVMGWRRRRDVFKSAGRVCTWTLRYAEQQKNKTCPRIYEAIITQAPVNIHFSQLPEHWSVWSTQNILISGSWILCLVRRWHAQHHKEHNTTSLKPETTFKQNSKSSLIKLLSFLNVSMLIKSLNLI